MRRDIDRLRQLGYPVESSPGTGGGYWLESGATLPPVTLDDEEAVAVTLGLHAGTEEAARRALVKLEQFFPAHLRPHLNALTSATLTLSDGEPAVRPEHLIALADAARDHVEAEFEYTTWDGGLTRRRCQPVVLTHAGRRWSLIAWDVERWEWAAFSIDRITGAVTTGSAFTPREPPDDVTSHLARATAAGDSRYQAVVTVAAPVDEVRARTSPVSATLEALDAGTTRLVISSHSLDSLAVHLSVLGKAFTVHSPEELIRHLEVLGRRLLSAART